jgi:hypothetical protein
MAILFRDLAPAQTVYVLAKGNEMKYCEGSIVSVGQPRMEMPNATPTPMTMPTMRQVVDVTYTVGEKNYTDAVDVTASVFPTEKNGEVMMVATEKEAIVKELHATLKSSENYITEAEKRVPKEKKRVKECKALIAQLDTVFMERQQTEQRFTKIEEAQKQQGDKLDEIIDMMKKIIS